MNNSEQTMEFINELYALATKNASPDDAKKLEDNYAEFFAKSQDDLLKNFHPDDMSEHFDFEELGGHFDVRRLAKGLDGNMACCGDREFGHVMDIIISAIGYRGIDYIKEEEGLCKHNVMDLIETLGIDEVLSDLNCFTDNLVLSCENGHERVLFGHIEEFIKCARNGMVSYFELSDFLDSINPLNVSIPFNQQSLFKAA